MGQEISRRAFVRVGTAGVMGSGGALLAGGAAAFGQGPAVRTSSRVVVVSSANGNKYTNGGPRTAVAEAYDRITRGEDVLDALIAGVNIVELDPEDDSVGYGGLPNADGVVQLDASVMHGPTKRAGAVASIEGVKTPSLVAKRVMEETDHHLIVGDDAQRFARSMGFKIEDDLNTERSRKSWLEWKRRSDPKHYLDPDRRAAADRRILDSLYQEGLLNSRVVHGTINCDGINAKGEICGVTTTSGLAWKIPGRVGDSPILGAGLYLDGDVGAAGSTGRGEANIYNLCSFLIVEQMRLGKSPKDAGMEALRRIQKNTIEKRLLNPRGLAAFGLSFYIVNTKGQYAGVSMYPSK